MEDLSRSFSAQPNQKWKIYLSCLREWDFAIATNQGGLWLIWRIYYDQGISSSLLSEQIYDLFQQKSISVLKSLISEYLFSSGAAQRKVLEKQGLTLPKIPATLLLLTDLKLPLQLRTLHPELLRLDHFDSSQILKLLSQKRCQAKETKILTLKVVEHLLASYLIYLDLSFLVELVFWAPQKPKRYNWYLWTYQIPGTDKVIKIYLPTNLLLPLFWIEQQILGYHALQKVAQELLNVQQLAARKALLAVGTVEDFETCLKAESVANLRYLSQPGDFWKLLMTEVESYK